MNKWTQAAKARRKQIDEAEGMAKDLRTLLEALPPGQRKQLIADDTCGAIISKYTQEVN